MLSGGRGSVVLSSPFLDSGCWSLPSRSSLEDDHEGTEHERLECESGPRTLPEASARLLRTAIRPRLRISSLLRIRSFHLNVRSWSKLRC